MAKVTIQSDEARLKKKLAERHGANQGDHAKTRALRKHLKRLQRKRRKLALRKQHAAKRSAAAAQPTA